MEPLKFNGVYKDYIWGGTRMKEKFGINSDISPLAESWVLSCHPDGESIISNGKHKGMALSEFIKNNPEVLGTSSTFSTLPILIKFIDAKGDLSVQVHPDDSMAKEEENQNGKTEMWYVIDSEKNSKITYGVKEDITKKELSDAIENNTASELLNTVPSKKGDVFFVDAGTIHAIGAGNLICEIQQNSNVTYRLYDYGRIDKNGKPRELHIEKGVKASTTKKTTPRKVPVCSDGTRLLGTCEYFQVKEIKLSKKPFSLIADEKSYIALIMTNGSATITYGEKTMEIAAGEVVFIPANMGAFEIDGDGIMLTAKNPPRYFAGIDLGGTNIAVSIVDEYGIIYGTSKKKTNCPRPYNEIFDDMVLATKEAAENSGIPYEKIESVGIGCPGAYNRETGILEFSNNIGFYDVPIKEYMQNALGKKVYIENDANAAAWGEFLHGAGKGTNSMVMFTLGTGVGGGIIIDGHLLRGAYGTGAEIGHMIIRQNGEKCTCGRRGCLEAYASATALIRQTKKAMKENPDSDLWRVAGGKISNVNGRTAFLAKDKVAKDVVKTYLLYLADGILDIANSLQPEVISIGGGISNQGDKLIKPLKKHLEKYAFARFGKKLPEIKIASLNNDAGIIGAALLWKDAE